MAVQPEDAACPSCMTDLTLMRAGVVPASAPVAVQAGKTCPGCGAAVSCDARECFQCHTRFAVTGELTPKQLRREIRWGVFQGLLLAVAIALSVYVFIFLLVLVLTGVGRG
jgi:ribosomal protein L40E